MTLSWLVLYKNESRKSMPLYHEYQRHQSRSNKSNGQLYLFQRKQEGKHTPKPAETSPPEEDFLSFFSLNESPYE